MKLRKRLVLLTALMAALLLSVRTNFARATPSSGEAEVRSAVEKAFAQLKAGDYGALYEILPARSKARISRARFTKALENTRNMYELDRLEIGSIRVSGNIATVDTEMFGRIKRPIESEGKIVAQQYLVREDGLWRVATGDRATIQSFLATNPSFARKFPVRQPRVFIKRDGRWIDVSSLRDAARAPHNNGIHN
jgi:hypothetical protein